MRINKNEFGIASIAIVAAIVAVLAIGGAGYYVMNRDKNDNGSQSNTSISKSEQKAIEAECKKEIDDKDFCKFASNFTLDGEYKMTISTTGGENDGTVMFETDDKGNTYSKFAGGGQSMEYVLFNGATYTRESGAEVWTKFPASEDTGISSELEESVIDESDFADLDTAQYTNEGKEACGSLTCFKFKIVDSAAPTLEQYVYFDDKEYKLRKFVTTENGETSEGIVEYVDVSISEPTPSEEFNLDNFNVEDYQDLYQ